MVTWDEVRREIQDRTRGAGGTGQQDIVRREKIAHIEGVTGRPLIVYAADFTNEIKASLVGRSGVSIDLEDKKGFIQATSDIPSGPLDVLIHSPGGSPLAAESIVHLLRATYSPIRFIIPDVAKSAATMLALSGDEVLMDPSAELGPIDPQLMIAREGRVNAAPAQAVLDQFERAHLEIKDNPQRVITWMPILREYGPSLIEECHKAIDLSKQLVTSWLQQYMFRDDPERSRKATRIADYLGNHNNFKSHGRRVGLDDLVGLDVGFKGYNLQQFDSQVHSAVMALYWAIDVTFDITGAYKLIEHKDSSAYIKQIQTRSILVNPPTPSSPQQSPQPKESLSRAERRRKQFSR